VSGRKARLGWLVPGVAALFLAAAAGGAEQSWTGVVGDSMCGASHSMDGGGNEMSDAACVISCVKSGEKYVLVSDGRSLEIANQDFAALKEMAGESVKLTGEMVKDVITIAKLELVN